MSMRRRPAQLGLERAARWATRMGRGLGAQAVRGWSVAVWAWAVVTLGCATVPGPGGPGESYQQRAWMPGEAWGGAQEHARRGVDSEAHAASEDPHVPPGWPDFEGSDEELLAPLLECSTPLEFLRLQQGVDMGRLVEVLEDFSAVRLGALGPLDARGSAALTRKRASFLITVTADYAAFAEVFALFVVHTSFDDELHSLLLLLARQKQLGQTLGHMEVVKAELERRGLKLSQYAERGEQGRDVLRGLASAARDAMNSTQGSDGGRFGTMWAQSRQLPSAYQQALYELGMALTLEHYAPSRAALGSVDQMTFGVPLGFYHLVGGTVEGAKALGQGQYEQATRQLAPAALVVGLYAGGKVARVVGARRAGAAGGRWAQGLAQQVEALKAVAQRLEERLGAGGLEELARQIRARREAGMLVAAEGELGALALYEARGDVAGARALLSQAKEKGAGPGGTRVGAGQGLGGLASLVDEAAGHTPEVVQAKLVQAELEATGPRLPADAGLLRKLNSTLATPPPGVPEGYVLWNEYVTYRHKRLAELEQGRAAEGPLRWEGYERMRGAFARGLAFERAMVSLLRADAALPQAQRVWLKGFIQPRVEVHVGVSKPGITGIRYADVLIIEERPATGQPPRVETFSFKSRNLAPLKPDSLREQIWVDARAALEYYGGTLDILRPSLKNRVQVQRVRLIYEGGELKPRDLDVLRESLGDVKKRIQGVEVLFQ
jgi:hypothetical protein